MNWKNYEHYIYYTFKNKYPDCSIEFDKKIKGKISGRVRQVDLFIDGKIAGESLTIIVDCKYFDKKIDIKIVESFLGFVKDVKGNRGILITNKGFTKTAYTRAYNDQNNDIKLEIVEFEQLYQFQGPGAIIHRNSGGGILQAPDGWVVDGKHVNNDTLATLVPYGLSLERAYQIREVMYCNIIPKEQGATLEKLLSLQEVGRLEFDAQSTSAVSPINLKRYDNLNGLYREIINPQKQYNDYTIFVDFEHFIFYACLIESLTMKGKHLDKLHFVVNSIIPLNVNHL